MVSFKYKHDYDKDYNKECFIRQTIFIMGFPCWLTQNLFINKNPLLSIVTFFSFTSFELI